MKSLALAIALSASVLAAAFMVPTLSQPLGAAAARYVDARADNIVFLWVCNSTVINENLTQYYQESIGAYVDGVYILAIPAMDDRGLLHPQEVTDVLTASGGLGPQMALGQES